MMQLLLQLLQGCGVRTLMCGRAALMLVTRRRRRERRRKERRRCGGRRVGDAVASGKR
jgi:hypothetical protein